MRRGFTLIEMIFVIVIFGILSKFGAELLYKIYENYIYSNTLNRLQNKSELAVKQIANRLQYRIKDSTISRVNYGATSFSAIGDGAEANVTEWIGIDIDGWRGDTAGATLPAWSGFIDLDASVPTNLVSPGTSLVDNNNMGIFFIGSDVDLDPAALGFGWNGELSSHAASTTDIKVVRFAGTNITSKQAGTTFLNSNVYEFYQASVSAFAVSLEADGKTVKDEYGVVHKSGSLWLYYDYKPWLGKSIKNGDAKKSLLVDDVISYKFTSSGDVMVVQVCVHDNQLTSETEAYAICKEKLVF